MKIMAAQRLKAALHNLKAPMSGNKPVRRYAVYVNNGYRFDLDCTIDAESLRDARKEFGRLHGDSAFMSDPKNYRLRDVTGHPGFE